MGRVWGVILASALCGLAGMGLEARQDQPPAPAPGDPQDRVNLVGRLDSWYKVLQGEEHVGFVRETVTREVAGQPWRYKYEMDGELELMLPDPGTGKESPYLESWKLEAHLDDTFSPVAMDRTDKRNGIEVVSRVVSDDNGRRIEVNLGQKNLKSFPVGDEEIYFSRFLMFVYLRQTGNLSGQGPRKVSMFAPRQDDRLPVAEVQFQVLDLVRREYMGKKEVPVTQVRFLKPPPAAYKDLELNEVFVDKFGRVVEETFRGNIRMILVKDETEAVGKETRIREGARRDPFEKGPAMDFAKRKGEEGVEKVKVEEVTPDTFLTRLKDMQKQIEDLRRAKEEEREAEGQKIYDQVVELYLALKRSHQEKAQPPVVMAQVEQVRDEAERVFGGLDRLMKKLRSVYVRVLQHFEKDECEEMAKGIEELRKDAQGRRELIGRPEIIEVNNWIGELEPLVSKCRTRQELAAKKITVTGAVIHDHYEMVAVDARVMVFGHQVGMVHPVRFMRPDRMAVINEKMYRVGDTVDGEGVRIEQIWAHGIQVSLREETRDIPIR
jgi:hypothetical protein